MGTESSSFILGWTELSSQPCSGKGQDNMSPWSLQGHHKLQAKQCPQPPASSVFAC